MEDADLFSIKFNQK